MKKAPGVMGGAKVLLYTPIDERHRPTDGCQHFVGGWLMGPAAGLAICRYGGDSAAYLFGRDENWESVTDTWHETLEEAKSQAEFEYEGVSATWLTREGSE
ncbi:MAG: hypothetical protein LC795_08530 [Acidobacteria bacterium]|nr:hypothetical protein [Acidobacteriota bacterium]